MITIVAKLKLESVNRLIDEKVGIKIEGCHSNIEYKIIARMEDDEGKVFESHVVLSCGPSGVIDLSTATPVRGNYDSADVTGLLWSMLSKEDEEDYFEKNKDSPIQVEFELYEEQIKVDEQYLHLHFKSDKVIQLPIANQHIHGSLYTASENKKYPAVILLNGSDGGHKANAAAYMASKGFTCLSLAYFNSENLNKELENIPLEYFIDTVKWLKEHPNTNGEVHLVGYSKGAELALLLASIYNEFTSVVAGAPGRYITSGMKDGVFAPVNGWLLGNKALPYIKNKYPLKMFFDYIKSTIKKESISFLVIWEKTLAQKEIEKFEIKTSNISCPIFLISGEDDQLWPSSRFSRSIEESRSNKYDCFEYYKEGGHFISFPYCFRNLPSNTHMKIGKMAMQFGGSKVANAVAAEETLAKILKFLNQHSSRLEQ